MDFQGDLSDDEDFLELVDIVRQPRRERVLRNRPNQFEIWNEEDFRSRYRLSKAVVHRIVDEVAETIKSATNKNRALTPAEMVLVTLRFLATGSILLVIGDFTGIDKGTASRVIDKVTNAIAQLHPRFIKMADDNNINEVIDGFYSISRFPRCIGAIDCTHIRIQSPGGDDAEIYRNRKGFFSLNIQAISDRELKIRNIVCRWPGSAHDSHIFRNSSVKAQLENGDFGANLILGDSGYGVKSYLITPLANPQTPAERLFNEAQIRTRNVVERCFGVWKRRFPVLSVGIKLHVSKVEAIVISAAVLHNIACEMRDEVPVAHIDDAFNADIDDVHFEENDNNEDVRNILINEYFQGLINNL